MLLKPEISVGPRGDLARECRPFNRFDWSPTRVLMVILLKLFTDIVSSLSANNVTTRAAQVFSRL